MRRRRRWLSDALRCAPVQEKLDTTADEKRRAVDEMHEAGMSMADLYLLAAAPLCARRLSAHVTQRTVQPQCAIRRGLDFRYNCRLQLQTERQAKLEWAKERDHAHVSQLAVRNGSSRALLNVQSPTHRAHSSACAHVHTIVRAQRMPLRVAVTSCACVCPQHVPRPVVPVPPTQMCHVL